MTDSALTSLQVDKLMHFVCDKHGDCRFRFGCRHIRQASRVVISPTPVVDDLRSPDIMCRECLTPNVKELREQLHALPPENYKRFFEYYEKLKTEIGYGFVCLECLYDNTGIDRRAT